MTGSAQIMSRSETGGERRDCRDQLEDFFESCAVCLHIVASDGTILRASRAELDLLGYTPEEYVGRHVAEFHADEAAIGKILRLLARGDRLDRHPARLRAKDGSIRYVEITSNAQFQDGQFVSTRCLTADVTQATLAEQRLQERERHSQQLLDALPAAIYTTDADGRITYYNQAAAELAGRHPEINKDKWFIGWRLYRPDGTHLPHDECPMAVAIQENRPIRGQEVVAERPDGTRVPLIPYPTPLRNADGSLVGAVNMLIDISERKRDEKTRELLIGELNHRVKNTLTTVQAIAQQTLRLARSPEEFVASFTGRIQALAKAHTLLSATGWSGAELSALIADQLLLGASEDSRISWSGPAIRLEPQMATYVALVLHELGSNARKFGALSAPDGALSIDWSLETNGGRALRIAWSETGSPSAGPPASRGFGTTLIDQIAKADGGEARMTCGASGIRWDIRLSVPADTIGDGPASSHGHAGSSHRGDADRTVLQGKRILIVEDEALIALELSQMLVDAGMEVAGIARSVAQAQRAMSALTYSAVMLDANLGGQMVDELAAALAQRDVPFAFMSGYGRESLPAAFRGRVLIPKPFTSRQMLDALAAVLSQSGQRAEKLEHAGI
ncbi:MAG: PAS domain S-box protein [Hyphomicrobiaceae bacterium]|nr:PAS domain S-box protein [Hyphomicrobiaceae bacterium]